MNRSLPRFGIFILLAGIFLCVSMLIYAPHGASVPTDSSTASTATGAANQPGVPDWAPEISEWTLNTGAGRLGFAKATGGKIAHGSCYMFHLGPFGTCTLQGSNFRFLRGAHTRSAVISLGLICAAVSVVIVLRSSHRTAAKNPR